MRVCRHCGKEFQARVGLGLCRTCWNDPDIRPYYAPVAPFGGAEAANLQKDQEVDYEPLDWHPFALKFPEIDGPDWPAFKESIRKTGGNEQPIPYRMVDGRKQGLDGRNRERACLQLGIKPTLQKVFISDDEVKEFILRRNVHRRHITPELRRSIVAELRGDGKSVREIADTLGVSHPTVIRDLTVSGGTHVPPETVTGRDGKTYPATRPPEPPPVVQEQPEPSPGEYGDAHEEVIPDEGEYDEPVYDGPLPIPAEPTRPIPTNPPRGVNGRKVEPKNGLVFDERMVEEAVKKLSDVLMLRSVCFGKDAHFQACWDQWGHFIQSVYDWRKAKGLKGRLVGE